jgi:hypothetical protein
LWPLLNLAPSCDVSRDHVMCLLEMWPLVCVWEYFRDFVAAVAVCVLWIWVQCLV